MEIPPPKSNSEETPDHETNSVEQISNLSVGVDAEQDQQLGQKKQQNDEDNDLRKLNHEDEDEIGDEEGINMAPSPLPQSSNAKSGKITRHYRKRKKGTAKKTLILVRKRKFEALFECFKPIPFVPVKTVDFSIYEENLKNLGLWDFAHVELDSNVRVDLVVQLVSDYRPKERCSYVNDLRVKVSRPDLARALKLPSKKLSGNCEGEGYSREFLSFLEEFVSSRMLLQDGDVWVTPLEIVNWLNLIKEGQPQKVDWAGMIWFMAEKELTQGVGLKDCYYALHFQQLIKDQRGHLLMESGGPRPEIEEVNLEDDEEDEDKEMLDARESLSMKETLHDPKCVVEVECLSGMGQKEGDANVAQKEGDADVLKDNDADVAQKEDDADFDVAQKEGDTDADVALKDNDADVAQKEGEGDADVAQKEGEGDADAAEKEGDTDAAEKEGGSDAVEKEGVAYVAEKEVDAGVAEKDNDVDMVQRSDELILPEIDCESNELKKVDIDDDKNENDVCNLDCPDETEVMENVDNVSFAENVDDAKEEMSTHEMVEFGLERDWLMDAVNDGGQHIMQRCSSLAGQQSQTQDTRPDDVSEDVEEEGHGFNFMGKSPMDVGHLSYTSAELGRDQNDVIMDSPPSMFNHVGKRELDHEHDFSHHALDEKYKRMRTDGHWDQKPVNSEACLDEIIRIAEKAKIALENEKYQQGNMMQVYAQQVDQKEGEIIQWRMKCEELQRKIYTEVNRRDRELHLMSSVIDGYRRALKETQRVFSEYRKNCKIPDEPIYKDVGNGGVVKSVMEIERERIKKEEEQKKVKYELVSAFTIQMNDFESEWEVLDNKVMLLDLRLAEAFKAVEELKDGFLKRKMPEKVEMSEEVQSEAEDAVAVGEVECKVSEDVVMAEAGPSEAKVVTDYSADLMFSEGVGPGPEEVQTKADDQVCVP